MEKRKFVQIMNKLQELEEKQDALCDAMSELSPDFSVDFYPLDECINIIVDLLNDEFNLSSDDPCGSDIEYYMYELEFGEKGNEMPIEENGVNYYLTDAEKLYDYITK